LSTATVDAVGVRRLIALVLAATAGMTLAACGQELPDAARSPIPPSPPTSIRIGPLTPTDPDRIPPEQAEAIRDLAETVSHDPPEPHAMDMSGGGPATTVVLEPADQATFDGQWAAAQAAATDLDTPDEAAAAGYTKAALQQNGIGAHWVNWLLIDRPFDPARPAMLLFDERKPHPELVAFSYWVHTPQPNGFAGSNDAWHRHTNLCIVNGWVDREMAATPRDCAGSFLAGSDLWMLHAWVVPGHENRWGSFAVFNPRLCARAAGTPDDLRCPTT
jgi:hypothetical protein